MDEIIIRKTGNTYVGEIAHKATATPLPAILKLDASEHYHVFEWQFNCWILRASQSTKKGALGYDGPNRVLVYREKSSMESEYDPLKLITCKCEACGWIDDFTAESLNKEKCAYGFCEDCDQERIFTLN